MVYLYNECYTAIKTKPTKLWTTIWTSNLTSKQCWVIKNPNTKSTYSNSKNEKNTLLPYDSAILFLGTEPTKMKTYLHTKAYWNMYPGFIHNSPHLITVPSISQLGNRETKYDTPYSRILLSNKTDLWMHATIQINLKCIKWRKPDCMIPFMTFWKRQKQWYPNSLCMFTHQPWICSGESLSPPQKLQTSLVLTAPHWSSEVWTTAGKRGPIPSKSILTWILFLLSRVPFIVFIISS